MGDAQAEIRQAIEERIAAIRAKDADRAIACLAEDVVAFEMVPPLALPPGAARDAEGFAAWLAGFEEVEVEIRDLRIEADGNVGFAHALHLGYHLMFVASGSSAPPRPVEILLYPRMIQSQ
jgi:ketosteroid isomerase-like protein